jgi:hypothetical protein
MSAYSDMLDATVQEVEAVLGIPATRDPSMVSALVSQGPGCIFVGFPTHAARLLQGPNLDVPISLVAPAPGDLQAVNWLLENMDALVEFCAVSATINGTLDIGDLTFPAVTVTARIAL